MRDLRGALPLMTLLAVLSLAGCTIFPESDAPDVWRLEPAGVPSEVSAVRFQGLRVMRPQADDFLKGNRILVIPEGELALNVYKGARWSEPAPGLLQDHLVGALQRDPRFARVSSDETQLAADHELVSRLDAFHSEYRNGRPVAVVRMHMQLVAMPGRSILAEKLFTLEQPSSGEGVDAVVKGFSKVAARLYADMSKWLLGSAIGKDN